MIKLVAEGEPNRKMRLYRVNIKGETFGEPIGEFDTPEQVMKRWNLGLAAKVRVGGKTMDRAEFAAWAKANRK